MQAIHHVFEVAAARARVYEALCTAAGLAQWWTTRVEADPRVGGLVDFTFGGDFNPAMRITALDEPTRIEWEFAGGHDPWEGSTFRFELADSGAGTKLRFWQNYGQQLSDDAYGVYNFNWGYYLESLRMLCEAGAGKPYQAGEQQVSQSPA
jgi:uncharacterized protein YndB with AHSA1/START domain